MAAIRDARVAFFELATKDATGARMAEIFE
jgi:hypothetical protein